MTIYLEENPPAISQFRTQRRAEPTGAIVVHTAENATDVVLPDTGAESVARYISTRTTFGSYHSVVDADSIVNVGRYAWEMFHEGSGGNRWSLGLSFACQAAQWLTLPADWIEGAIRNGATEAAQMAAWIVATTGVSVPARRITPAEYRAGQPGFITHAELDPGRRSDPGHHFPWDRFLALFASLTNQGSTPPTMSDYVLPDNRRATVRRIQEALKAGGYYGGEIDEDPYTMTAAAAEAAIEDIQDLNELVANKDRRIGELEASVTDEAELRQRAADLEADVAEAEATAAALEADNAALRATNERLLEQLDNAGTGDVDDDREVDPYAELIGQATLLLMDALADRFTTDGTD